MAYKYNRSRNDFILNGPVNKVTESQYGSDEGAHIYFPGVSTCSTFTLFLSDTSALGMHLDKLALAEDVDAICKRLNQVRGERSVRKLYALGILQYSKAAGWMGVARYTWPLLLATLKTAFGVAGNEPVFVYDEPYADASEANYKGVVAREGIAWFRQDGKAVKGEAWDTVSLVAH